MNKPKNEINEKENIINNNSLELNMNNEIKVDISSNNSNNWDSLKNDLKQPENLFIKVLSELNSNSSNIILNYLSIKELINLTGVNHSTKLLLEKYFPLRLKIEYDD